MLESLLRHNVDFVLIGGLAATIHGSVRATFDVDIAFSRDSVKLERLDDALREVGASSQGELDVGNAAGASRYRDLRAAAVPIEIHCFTVRVASIDHLIPMKEASGHLYAETDAAELRAISDELRAT